MKKKTFPIFENLHKTSGTTTKALSYLKTPLTRMRVDRFESCKNIVPRLQTSSISAPSRLPGLVPKSPWRNSSTASAEEFYSSFHFNVGLENKLIRAPLLGLAKSIYYRLMSRNPHGLDSLCLLATAFLKYAFIMRSESTTSLSSNLTKECT